MLGAGGQVGSALDHALAPLGTVIAAERSEVDLQDADAIRIFIRRHAPEIIVNAAAYTAVDKAEGEADKAMAINGTALGVLAEEAKEAGSLLVHYSTDYVFDGTKAGAYSEGDAPNPLSVYGRTKLAGERALQASGCRYFLFRTSWVYGSHGGNFVKTILRLAADRSELSVVSDQEGAPTSAWLIAEVTAACIALAEKAPANHPTGIYHLAASGSTTWHAYAQYIVESASALGMRLKVDVEGIQAVSSAEYGAPAVRPRNSRLSTDKLEKTFGLVMPDWREHVRDLVSRLCAAQVQ